MASDSMEAGNSPTAQHSSSCNLNRRSLSIFSRRGADTPTPATQTLAIASMSMAFASPPIAGQSNKQKRWRLSKDTKIPEGTILRMVPKDAPVTEMTPLEREMATSPNEEILRSIGLAGTDSVPVSPEQAFPPTPLADITNTSPRRYYSTKRAKKNGQGDIIGIWRNGRAQWEWLRENGRENDGTPRTEYALDTGSEIPSDTSKTDKPKIQVVIPNNPSARRPFNFVPFFSRPLSEATLKGITASHTDNQDISPPHPASGQSMDSFQISAVTPSPIIHKPIPLRPYVPVTPSDDEAAEHAGSLYPDRPSHAPNRSLSNSSNSGSDHEENASQFHSSRSSMTSIGDHPTDPAFPTDQESDRDSKASSSSGVSLKDGDDENARTDEARTHSPARSSNSPIADGLHMADFIDKMRSPSMQRHKAQKRISSSRGTLKLARIDSKEELRTAGPPSPTLSEAERSLEVQLTDFAQKWSPIQHQPSMSSPDLESILPPADVSPPPPPRKSSKRRTRRPSLPAIPKASSEAFSAAAEATQQARKIRQQQVAIPQKAPTTQPKLHRSASALSILNQVCEHEETQAVDANAAEAVILHILNNVHSLQDLFSTAVITKGFYKVFKAHEMDSIRRVLRTQNPAAWEYLEICRPAGEENDDLYSAAPSEEYTPATYIQKFRAACRVTSNLKKIISGSCQNQLRRETLAQSFTESPFTCSSRMDNALWRIWSFCRIFGCGKGREDDLIAQLDWLRGGRLAHQDSCSSTISTSDALYISSVLLNAPDHFGKGNNGGLNAEELYDILEVLECLNNLSKTLLGHTEQARRCGVYDNTNVEGGDIDGEEDLLEEWTHYLLTLGLQPITELVVEMKNDPVSVFSYAQEKGWTRWTPPATCSSLQNFLHEAVSRLYEEKICETFSPEQYRTSEMRSIRRSRAPSFHSSAHRHRSRNLSAACSIRTSASERPATSGREGLSSTFHMEHDSHYAENFAPTTITRRHTIVRKPVRAPRPPPPSRTAPIPPLPHSNSALNPIPTPNSPPPTRTNPTFPTLIPQEDGSWLSHPPPNPITTTIDDPLPTYPGRPLSWRQHPLQLQMNAADDDNPGANTAAKAVFRIVEMGFTPEEAKAALKITDMGDGLRVDRAVELLLRRMV
ncbi:hypothetical protein FKW77_005886 [Venturia effusa]|uniref:UBA domain-containing protein n=1 Tax=Venturia effusa TaxID=50376 RepID=A0A517L3H1_9PEZI|nr:hypothetical protein FKW77_005886 [Venturia effusa]